MQPRIRDVLASAPLFAGLPPHVLAELAALCTARHLRDGAPVPRRRSCAARSAWR